MCSISTEASTLAPVGALAAEAPSARLAAAECHLPDDLLQRGGPRQLHRGTPSIDAVINKLPASRLGAGGRGTTPSVGEGPGPRRGNSGGREGGRRGGPGGRGAARRGSRIELDRQNEMRIGGILQRLGFERRRKRVNGKREWRWFR